MVLILRELLVILYFIIFLIFLKKKEKNIERIHLNELELIICAPFLKFFYNCIITSHLRCPLEIKKGRFRYSFLKYLTKKYIKKIVAIDFDCYKTTTIKDISLIIHNGINKKNLKIKKKPRKGITFGFIGSFINRKGIYETLDVFKNFDRKIKVNLICVGSSHTQSFLLRFLQYEKNFEKYLIENKINKKKNIKILPMTFDLKSFYSQIDIILFPGYMNAVGRPVIEAALLKKTSIIALNRYNNDTAMKNNCLIFKPGNLKSFKNKILYLINNKSKIKKMGDLAFKNAIKNFDINKNSKLF